MMDGKSATDHLRGIECSASEIKRLKNVLTLAVDRIEGIPMAGLDEHTMERIDGALGSIDLVIREMDRLGGIIEDDAIKARGMCGEAGGAV